MDNSGLQPPKKIRVLYRIGTDDIPLGRMEVHKIPSSPPKFS